MFTLRPILPLVASLTLCASASALQEADFQTRLEELTESLEAARVEANIPGMSIAIVKDDEVVLARGFGLADVDTERAADAETIYAIGSTTKAFTATLIGTLVDESRASWDDPVTRFLPYFDLAVQSDDPDATCTLRDLLSHRHGFARMSILWFGSDLSREEILRTAVGAEPFDEFREGFHYCNVTYMAAGEAAGVAAGSSWDELMHTRIFEPLGMNSSSVNTSAAQEDPRLALGYTWDAARERIEHMPMVDLATIGPAGSVNSNVLDMSRWLRLQLGQGEFEGERMISTESLLETWEPQIAMGAGAAYGLGWMLREHDGRKLVEHGGNIDGFSAQVGLCPEENLGFVLLMNRDVAPLQQPSLQLVFDTLLAQRAAPVEAAAALEGDAQELDLDEFTGIYLANFATFDNERFEVTVQGEGLALDIPSQQNFELEMPDEQGHWRFSITDQIAISFERDGQGDVVALTVHQNQFHFEVPREGVEVAPEVPAEELEKFVGTFVRDRGGKNVQITIERGRLTLNNRGQKLAFHTPDQDGHAALRARADQGATFAVDADGHVDSFVFHGDAGDRVFTRKAGAASAELPSLAEVLSLRGTEGRVAALDAAGGIRFRGTVRFAQSGVDGTIVLHTLGRDRYANHMDFGRFGQMASVARGSEAWTSNPMRGFKTLAGAELTQALLEHPGAVAGDWSEYFDSVEVVRNEPVRDRATHVVRLEKDDFPSRSYWVDAENGNVLRVKSQLVEGSLRVPVTIDFLEFEELDGIQRATHTVIENPMTGRTVIVFESMESGLELGEEVFSLEDPAAEPATGD